MAAAAGWPRDGVGGKGGGHEGDADGGGCGMAVGWCWRRGRPRRRRRWWRLRDGCGMVLVERAAAAEATQMAAAAETGGWLQDGSDACSEDETEDACLLRCSDACNV
jgi:hypothetical protein